MSDTHTLRLGPLSFRTVAGAGPTETVGNAIEVVGSALVSADPAPKPFTLQIPVGFSGRAAREEGVIARQQLRALFNNAEARMQGLYFSWSVDPELDAWLIVGGGDLVPSADSVVLGEWLLTLRDCFVAGRRRTHREAIVVTTAHDRRLANVPRDSYRRIHRGADFSTRYGRTLLSLPAGATDVLFQDAAPALLTRPSAEGPVNVVRGLEVGAVAHFERADPSATAADVRIRDPRGDTEATWVDVYGPDQRLTELVPVLENGLCRVMLNGWLRLFAWDGSWRERGRIAIGGHLSTHIESWTPDRATISMVTLDFSSPDLDRVVTLLTLARGWHGPQIEVYAPNARLRYHEASGSRVSVTVPAQPFDTMAIETPLSPGGAQFTTDNWLYLGHGGRGDVFAVSALHAITWGNEPYVFGATRSWVELASPRWVGARLSLGVEELVWLQDMFFGDTRSLYTTTGTPAFTGAGYLAFGSTGESKLVLVDYAGHERRTWLEFRTGSSVTSWRARLLVRHTADGFIAGQLSSAGTLSIVRNRRGSETVLATAPFPGIVPNFTSTAVMLTDGDHVRLMHGSSVVEHRLSAADMVTFPAGSGRTGFAVTPGSLDWRVNVFAADGSAAAAELSQSLLLDARSTPTLIARN